MFYSRFPRSTLWSPCLRCQKKLQPSLRYLEKTVAYSTQPSKRLPICQSLSTNSSNQIPFRPKLSTPRGSRAAHSQQQFGTQNKPKGRLRLALEDARHEYPVLLPLALFGAVGMLAVCGYLLYDQNSKELLGAEMEPFSPAVKKHLRTAIWYSEIKPDPVIMVDAFNKALAQMEREGIDPLNNLCLGITIRFVQALDKAGQAKGAVSLLKITAEELQKRIDDLKRERGRSKSQNGKDLKAPTVGDRTELPADELRRLQSMLIKIHSRLGDLYSNSHLQDLQSARGSAHDAVTALVKSMPDSKFQLFEINDADISPEEAIMLLSAAGTLDLMCDQYSTGLVALKLALGVIRRTYTNTPTAMEIQVLNNLWKAVMGRYLQAVKTKTAPTPEEWTMMADVKGAPQSYLNPTVQLLPPDPLDRMPQLAHHWAIQAVARYYQLALNPDVVQERPDEKTVIAALDSSELLVDSCLGQGDVNALNVWCQSMLAIANTEGVGGEEGMKRLKDDGWTDEEVKKAMDQWDHRRKAAEHYKASLKAAFDAGKQMVIRPGDFG